MARPRKTPLPDEVAVIVGANDTAGEVELPEKILVRNTLHSTWMDTKPPLQAKPAESLETPAPVEDEDDYFSEVEETRGQNQLDELFDGFESAESVVTVVVYEFPNFERDGNSSMGSAKKIFAGSCDLPPDIRSQDALLQFVRERYAHPTQPIWHFKLQLRQKGRVGKTSKVLSVRPYSPYQEPVSESMKTQSLPAAPAPVPVDPFAEVEKSLKFVERLKAITGTPAPAPVQTPASQRPEDISLDAAIFRMISEDKELVSRTIERFIPAEPVAEAAEIPWWRDVIKEAAPHVAPLLVSGLAGLLTRFFNPQTPPAGAEPVSATPPPAGGPPPIDVSIAPRQVGISEELGQAISAILHGIENGIAASFTAETISRLAESRPALESQLDPVLNNPPSQVLHWISSLTKEAAKVCEMPGAEDYIKQLQAEFSEQEPEA